MSAATSEDEHAEMAFCLNPPFPSTEYSPTHQVCTPVRQDMAPAARNRNTRSKPKHHATNRHASSTDGTTSLRKSVSSLNERPGPTWRMETFVKHFRSLERRDAGPAAEEIDHAPPPYIAPPSLHAGTVPADSVSTLPAAGEPASPIPGFGAASTPAHGTNVGLLVGLLLGGAALFGILAAIGMIYWKRSARNLRALAPKVTPWRPQASVSTMGTLSMSSSFGNFVLLSTTTSEEDVASLRAKSPEDKEFSVAQDSEGPPKETARPTDPRRFSSPSALGATFLRAFRNSKAPEITTSVSAPASPSLASRDRSLHVQRQKAAELAQMVRMKFVKEEMPTGTGSSTELAVPAMRRSITAGLGIVHRESEVDIASTLLCALDRYSVSFDASSPTVPITNLFQVGPDGRVVRRPAAPSPASDVSPMTPQSAAPDTGSVAAEDDSEDSDDVNDAVIVRIGQARSMEIKPERGMLVSLHTAGALAAAAAPPASLSTPVLAAAAPIARPRSAGALPAPPVLSPITTSPTSLSADIEESLEERVFAYRQSGPWSKAQYQLTTPGQVRALSEALGIARPHAAHREQAWPWPAHRNAALGEVEDE